jgi:uncharacterized protein YndB with AHSA1/START domain
MTTPPVLLVERTLAAPLDRVYAAWTEPAQLSRWWGPRGMSVDVLRFELRERGHFHYAMRSPNGDEMFGRFRFIEVDPPTQLVWANGFADAAGALVPAPFPGLEAFPLENLNTLTLRAAGPGQTRLRLRSTPLSDDPAAHAAFAGLLPSMEGGFGGTLTSLEEFLAHGT